MNVISDAEKTLTGIQGPFQSIDISNSGSRELQFWQGKKETDVDAFPRLKEYWDYVQFGDNWSPSETPWSAAFISYVLRDQGFPKRAAHRLYMQDIIDGKSPSWGAFSIPKTDKLQLHVGDVLIKPRSGNYNNSHGDVVYKIEKGQAFLIGGNLGNTARITEIFKVDEKGFVQEDVSPYLVILKKKGTSNKIIIPLVVGAIVSLFFITRNS
jgi:hypothetical protein|tara:strand:+ start:46 stop:678 length:633 start_codon:yes stop_codon:yes gene_type:complete